MAGLGEQAGFGLGQDAFEFRAHALDVLRCEAEIEGLAQGPQGPRHLGEDGEFTTTCSRSPLITASSASARNSATCASPSPTASKTGNSTASSPTGPLPLPCRNRLRVHLRSRISLRGDGRRTCHAYLPCPTASADSGEVCKRKERPGATSTPPPWPTASRNLAAVAATEAAFLARVSAARKPPVLARFDDGSYLSRFGGVEVRIIECEITITTSQGRQTGLYRLATNLLDHHRYPASDLVSLYHERWEVESAYFAIKKSMLGRRVLRSKTWAGIAQEVYSLLSAYQGRCHVGWLGR
ncbi:transposase [Streptomyces sp. NPDC058239]|uniref:transposase n=1 Tax=unclassified Streptomyces TaxID=2593676 RepID=UPI0036478833